MINDEESGTKFPTSVAFTTWFVAVAFVPVELDDCAYATPNVLVKITHESKSVMTNFFFKSMSIRVILARS